MSENTLLKKVETLMDWQKLLDEAELEVSKLKEELKDEMDSRQVEELHVGNHVLRYQTIFSKRFQSQEFSKIHKELYDAFCAVTKSRRFSCN